MKNIEEKITFLKALKETIDHANMCSESRREYSKYWLRRNDPDGNDIEVTPEDLKEINEYSYDNYMEEIMMADAFHEIAKELEKLI